MKANLNQLKISVIFILFTVNIHFVSFSQYYSKNNIFAKQWSQEMTLEMAKLYLVKNIVSVGNEEEYIVLDAMTAANSGELTSICYAGDSAKTVGVLLAFYGNYWNENGVEFKGYEFKNLKRANALEFLKKIIEVSEKYQKFMDSNFDNHNMVFTYEDIVVIMYANSATKLRVIWHDFDAEWTIFEAKETLKRFEKFIDN